jgi:hypothetical protein
MTHGNSIILFTLSTPPDSIADEADWVCSHRLGSKGALSVVVDLMQDDDEAGH